MRMAALCARLCNADANRATVVRAANRGTMNTRYTLVLGTKDWSSWSLRAYVAMRATGAPFEEVFVRLRQQPLTGNEIRNHSAAGKVPILKIAEGSRNAIVWDSLAICETLAGRSVRTRRGALLRRRDALRICRCARSAFDGLRAAPAAAAVARGDAR